MMNIRKLLPVLVVVFLVLAISFVYMFNKASKHYNGACEGITAIAKDKEKISYLENWKDSKINEPKFLELMGKSGVIRLLDSPELMSSVGIDWEYLGLNKEYAFVKFNRSYKDWDDYMDSRNIKSFSVGQGRLGIIIRMSDSDELGLEWPIEALKLIKPIDDRVSVYCND